MGRLGVEIKGKGRFLGKKELRKAPSQGSRARIRARLRARLPRKAFHARAQEHTLFLYIIVIYIIVEVVGPLTVQLLSEISSKNLQCRCNL